MNPNSALSAAASPAGTTAAGADSAHVAPGSVAAGDGRVCADR